MAGPAFVREGIVLRPIADTDAEFLYQVYASTRQEELSVTGWTSGVIETFLRSQFAAQHRHYQTHYTGAAFDVIVLGGIPAGRLYVHRGPGDIRVMDIALLPEFRRRGIGTTLIQEIVAEAAAKACKVSLYVEYNNPASGLYARLGFTRTGESGVYVLMECLSPAASHSPQSQSQTGAGD